MEVRCYGSLKDIAAGIGDAKPIAPITVKDFIEALALPESAVKLVMINHAPAHPNATIQLTDSVALFPKEYPFFADWKDYWQKPEV